MTMAGDVYASNRGLQWTVRVFGWCMLVGLPVYFFNNYLIFVLGWPGIGPIFSGGEVSTDSWIQLSLYFLGLVFAIVLVRRTSARHLRDEAAMITRFNTYLVRAAFWAVFLVGLVDMSLSFLRIEDILPHLIGDELNVEMGRAH